MRQGSGIGQAAQFSIAARRGCGEQGRRQAEVLEEFLGFRPPDIESRQIAERLVRVILEPAERDQARIAPGLAVALHHVPGQPDRKQAVVVAVKPDRRQVRTATVVAKGAGQPGRPIRATADLQAAGEIDQAQHPGDRRGAQRHGGQAAVRLAHHDDTARIDIGPAFHVVDRGAHVAGLDTAVFGDVAAGIDKAAPRFRKPGTHRQHDRVAAAHEFAARGEVARARLQGRVAGVFAMIDDHQRKRAGAIGLEDGGLQRHGALVGDGGDFLVERLVEERLESERGRRQRCEQAQPDHCLATRPDHARPFFVTTMQPTRNHHARPGGCAHAALVQAMVAGTGGASSRKEAGFCRCHPGSSLLMTLVSR